MAKNWVSGAIKRPGQLHRDLHIPQGKKIPLEALQEAIRRGGKIAQRARYALTARRINAKR